MRASRRGADITRRWAGAFGLVRRAAGRWLFVILALSVVNGLVLALQLLIGQQILEVLIEQDDPSMDALTPWLIMLALVLLIVGLTATVQQKLQEFVSELVARQALDEILAVSAAVDFAEFEDPGFHDDLQRAEANAVPRVWSTVLGFVGLTNQVIGVVALAAVVLTVMPVLLVFAAVAYAPLWWATTRNARSVHAAVAELAVVDRDLRYHRQVLTGRVEAKEVRIFRLGEFLRVRHRELFDRRVRRVRAVVTETVVRSALGLTVSTALLVAAIAVLLWQTVDGPITVSAAAVGVVGVQQLGGRARGLDATASSLQEGMLFFEDFERFLHHSSVDEPADPGSQPSTQLSRVEVSDLGFTYPGTDRPVLHDVSFAIERQQVVAIVGPNGSGKSTLAKLLCGLYEPTAGRVAFDGIDVATLGTGAVRAQVSPVFQDFTRYEFSARENIGFGDVDNVADQERIGNVARSAGADEFIRRLPHGYETRLSREYADGADVSVGQWQRLAIGRALMGGKPLVVLDEPSSALDSHAESELFDRVRELAEDRIVVLISHRLASVREADLLLVLENGRLVESGTHDDLVAVAGPYQRLYYEQARRYA